VESAFCSCLACSIASSFRISYPRGLPAPIIMHRRDAHRRHHFSSSSGSIYATGIGNGSTRSTDGNPEPRERLTSVRRIAIGVITKIEVVRDRTIAGTTRLVKS